MNNKPYKIGLDIGTGSVGWAVVDEENNLIKYKRQNMWGSRIFSEAETAESRRMNRTARRRLDRRNRRLSLLRQLFSQAVLAQDESFFIRMKESMLDSDDKSSSGNFLLFNGSDFSDKDFHQKYPTIYHLRNDLIQNKDQKDARLVYLAIHHILKNRGNFLYEKEFNLESLDGINQDIDALFEILKERFSVEITGDAFEIVKILKNQRKTRAAKQKDILSIINFEKSNKDIITQIIRLFCGLSSDFSKIFPDDFDKNTKKEFNEKFDEEKVSLESQLGEDFEIIEVCERIYSWMILQSVLNGKKYLSEAMIERYEQHKKDLALLKKISKNIDKKVRKKFFNEIYEEYIHQPKLISKRKQNSSPYVVLKDEIKKLLDEVPAEFSTQKDEILNRLELGVFLPKLRTSDNGKIPRQIHKQELVEILENQAKFYPELAENKDKIISLLDFRIPYYVGPMVDSSKTGQKHNFAWMKLKDGESGEILPWNFDQKVDKLASAEEFITRMTNDCSYLFGETVLPKNSLIYSEFTVRNEINNLRINNRKVSDFALREDIFNLFLENKTVSVKTLEKFLKNRNFPEEAPKVSGLADEKKFLSSLSALHDLRKAGVEINIFDKDSKEFEMAENLIRWITLFGENKEILELKIKEKYHDVLTDGQIKKLINLKLSGWGRLSKKLLAELKTPYEGENLTILDVLRRKNVNFMEIITKDEFDFKEQIESSQQSSFSGEITYETIKELAGSPAIKRGIWQSLKIVDEIVEIMGYKPAEISIEMAREKQNSKRTKSRSKIIEDLFAKIPKTELGDVSDDFKKDLNLNDDRVMLYFLQLGKSAYSGTPLTLETLSQTTQIEHIIPQHLIKDDSFSNRVLVLNDENQSKGGDLIVPDEIRQKMTPIWHNWLKNGLMTPSKYARLTRSKNRREELTQGFINRQLVETRQITKHVANILTQKFANECSVRIVKASLSSNLRNKFNWPKNRELNDFHHAKDAYLAVVLGNFLQVRFPKMDREFIYDQYLKFNKDIKKTSHEENGFIVGAFARDLVNIKTGEIIWDFKKNFRIIDRTMRFNDCLVTKKLEENTGKFYDITIISKNEVKSQKKKPSARKKNLSVEKYGGMTGEQMAYSIALEFDNDKKRVRKIVGMPVRFAKSPNEYLSQNYPNYKILRDKIFKNQLILRDGSPQYLTSYQEVNNAKQLKLPYEFENFIANLAKILAIPNIEVGDNRFMILANRKLGFNFEANYENPVFSSEDRKMVESEISIKLNELFDFIVNKSEKEFTIFSSEMKKLAECRPNFEKLSIKDKCETIIRIFRLLHANVSIVDFDHIGWRKSVGQKQIPGGIKIDENIVLVRQSITGLKTKKFKIQ